MASLKKTFLSSLKNVHKDRLTTTHGHLQQKLRLNRWKPREIRELIEKLADEGVIRVTKTPTHITLVLVRKK